MNPVSRRCFSRSTPGIQRSDRSPARDVQRRENNAGRASPRSSENRRAAENRESEIRILGPYKPIQKGVTGAITPQQTKYLENFIERYTSRTQGSKRLAQQHRAKLEHPRVAAAFRAQWKDLVYPITIERSLGSKLWDVDGNEYIDILNGFGVTMFGHCPAFVREAVEKQLQNGIEIGPQIPVGKVAELLCELTGNDRATFCNTGSEAVMAAMRFGPHRNQQEKDRFLHRRLSRFIRRSLGEGHRKAGKRSSLASDHYRHSG